MKKRIVVLGSTGSIGRQTLDVVRMHPDEFEVVALGAGRDVESLAAQIHEFHPQIVGIADSSCAKALADTFQNKINLIAGEESSSHLAAIALQSYM